MLVLMFIYYVVIEDFDVWQQINVLYYLKHELHMYDIYYHYQGSES